jgi:putative cardiolipin synthase
MGQAGGMTAALARLSEAHPGESGVQLLDDGPAALAVRLHLVRRARHQIDAQYYIWRNDVSGRLLLDELAAAAARGVKVRLIVDDVGTSGMDAVLAACPGIEVRLFNPLNRRWPRAISLLFDLKRLNRRMHNKSLTVDGVATVVGGRNIGDEYFDDEHPSLAADLDVLGIGAIAGAVEADFEHYWNCAVAIPLARLLSDAGQTSGALPPPTGQRRAFHAAAADSAATQAMIDEARDFEWCAVRMLSDPPAKITGAAGDDTLVLPRLLAALGDIRQRLLVVSAYFVPAAAGTAYLTNLARQGLRIDILTNSLKSTDVALVHAWYAPWRKRLLAAGVRLWEMQGSDKDRVRLGLVPRSLRRVHDDTSFFRQSASALHAKTLVADGRWLFVGSMNFDPRSVRFNTEMGFLIDSPLLAGRLDKALVSSMPIFAWQLELDGRRLRWRHGDRLFAREPGANWLQRTIMRLIGRLPLGHFL